MKQAMYLSLLGALLSAAFPLAIQAQQRPDAGLTLQQQQTPPQPPRPGPKIGIQAPAGVGVPPGGPTVTLSGVKFQGNTVLTEAELLAALGDVHGKTYDLAGLQGLAQRVSEYYRARGYPFVRALIPAQTLAGGVLLIQVVEGRYGKVEAQGDAALAASAQRYLSALETGAVIESRPLERAVLILSDQPGVRVAPLLRPGQEIGTSDLTVEVSRERMFKAEVGADNHGNRYSGAYRAKASLQADSPFMLGDQFKGQVLYTDEGLWLGALSYSLPLGASGLRGSLGFAHTYYELGEDYASLEANGTADITSLGLTYPLVRSQQANLTAGLTLQHKELTDRQDATATRNDKDSDAAVLALAFDRRDGAGGGGVSYGSLTYTTGRLDLDDALEAADIASGMNTRGSYHKWTLDVARQQATPIANLGLYGRLSAQWAGKNLDSSEAFLLGGPHGVRAYPVGEGSGDEGWLVQLEARYQIGRFAPYAFYDAGRATLNADNDDLTAPAAPNRRSIAGAGLGLRYADKSWSADAAIAWRTHGGKPQSDTRDDDPRLWVTARYLFD